LSGKEGDVAKRSRAKAKRRVEPDPIAEPKEVSTTQVQLKETTRAMVERGRINHVLPKDHRDHRASIVRQRRKLGETNMWLMQLVRFDKTKRYKPGAGPVALQEVGSAGTSVGDCSGSSALSQDVSDEALISASSVVSNSRLRQRRVSPHPMQAEFSFGSD
jgi:hypothetical protein